MNHIATKVFIFLVLFSSIGTAHEQDAIDPMIQHPEWYIKVTDWSFYTAFRVAMISNVTIENTADIAYKNIKIKINYYSNIYTIAGQQLSSTTGVLPITIPPRSKETYLKGGMPIGMGATLYYTKFVQILGAVPIVKGSPLTNSTNTGKPKLTLSKF